LDNIVRYYINDFEIAYEVGHGYPPASPILKRETKRFRKKLIVNVKKRLR
jgi:hypothetical protein